MSEDWDIPVPAFKPDEALLRLRRDLRELGLSEREGRFERKGEALARAAVSADGTQLLVAMVKRPARSPDWQERTLRDGAQVRDFVAELKKKLALWSDRDE
jgi:hypothetical protein